MFVVDLSVAWAGYKAAQTALQVCTQKQQQQFSSLERVFHYYFYVLSLIWAEYNEPRERQATRCNALEWRCVGYYFFVVGIFECCKKKIVFIYQNM